MNEGSLDCMDLVTKSLSLPAGLGVWVCVCLGVWVFVFVCVFACVCVFMCVFMCCLCVFLSVSVCVCLSEIQLVPSFVPPCLCNYASHWIRVLWIGRVERSTHVSKRRFFGVFSVQRGTPRESDTASRPEEVCMLNPCNVVAQ